MIEDMKHLETLQALTLEIESVLFEHGRRASGQTDRDTLVRLYLERGNALIELVKRQRRALLHMSGQPVEPEAHRAEVVLIGRGGLAS